jgi:hypothetical protein
MKEKDSPLHIRVNEVSVRVRGEGIVKGVEARARIRKDTDERSRTYNFRFSRNVNEGTPLSIRSVKNNGGDGVALTRVIPALQIVAERVEEHIPEEYEVEDVTDTVSALLSEGYDVSGNLESWLPEKDKKKYEKRKPEGGDE